MTEPKKLDPSLDGELSEDDLEHVTGGTKNDQLLKATQDLTEHKSKTADKAAEAVDKYIRG